MRGSGGFRTTTMVKQPAFANGGSRHIAKVERVWNYPKEYKVTITRVRYQQNETKRLWHRIEEGVYLPMTFSHRYRAQSFAKLINGFIAMYQGYIR